MITRGRHTDRIVLPPEHVELLSQLHMKEGAWAVAEARAKLTGDEIRSLIRQEILQPIWTEIGPLVVLSSLGQIAVFGNLRHDISIETQQNKAYFRLALAAFGWRLATPTGWNRGLEAYDKTGRFREVITPDGHALVSAKLTANGYSRKHFQRVVQRLKSTALAEDFQVILITPNARKGQRLIEKNASFLQVVQYLPDLQADYEKLVRLARPKPHTEPPDPGPYLAGEAWRTDPKYIALPLAVQHILTSNRDKRIAAALRSIEVDGVMSAAQLYTFYGLQPADLPGIFSVRTYLRTSPLLASSEQAVTFLTLSRRLARLDDHRLAHRCGTGRMRHLLNVPADPSRWKAEYRGRLKLEEPDALFVDARGDEIAIEYDGGTYSPAVIERKIDTFSDRGFRVIWGVSHLARKRKLNAEIGIRLVGGILLAEWWT